MNKKVTLKDVKESLQPTIQLIKTHTLCSEDISLILHMAIEEILYPQQKSIQDRIIPKDFGRWESKVVDPKDVPFKSKFKNSEVVAIEDTRPCDTEPSDNTVIRVDFK